MKQTFDAIKDGLDEDRCAYILADCACLNLRKASRAITQMYDEALKPTGLRSTQLPVLVTLVSAGQTTVNYLAEDLVMDRTSLSRLLRPLVAGGLIEMAPGRDRRTRELSITAAGSQRVAAAFPMWDRVQNIVLDRLGQRRLQDLIDDLSVAAALSDK